MILLIRLLFIVASADCSVLPTVLPTIGPSIAPTFVPSPGPTSVRSTQNNVYLVAGAGTASTSGTGGKATSANFNVPRGMWQDSTGALYITESSGYCVRNFALSDSIVQNFAGQCGTQGNSGDGKAATSALFNYPMAIVFDSVGVFYLADNGGHRVRSVSTSSIISTYAGTGSPGFTGENGQATSAQVNSPTGIWVSTVGIVFFSEFGNYIIRSVATNGIIKTYAGVGTSQGSSGNGIPATSALFANIERVFGDTVGKIYIADSSNYIVRLVSASGIVTNFAGNFGGAYTEGQGATSTSVVYPAGMSIDPSNADFFVNSRSGHKVLLRSPTTGLLTTVLGTGTDSSTGDGGAATSGNVKGPECLFLDTNGKLYVLDLNANNLRVVYTVSPSAAPTVVPTVVPTLLPSMTPTTTAPTVVPSVVPTTMSPTTAPSTTPTTTAPTVVPSIAPSTFPTELPTTTSPTIFPSLSPTTIKPSLSPSLTPSISPSCVPTVYPSIKPSVGPSIAPSVVPTIHPTLSPSVQPSATPTAAPTFEEIYDSPYYKISNAFAFAGLTDSGSVKCWGSTDSGGDCSSVESLLVGVSQIVAGQHSFVALLSSGGLVAWGKADSIAGWQTYDSTTVSSLVASERAFAGVTSSGGVIAFGAACCGGYVNQYGWSQYLSSGVVSVHASSAAIAAVKSDGSVYCWGSKFVGGGVSSLSRSDLSSIVQVTATRSSFVALTSGGNVVAWGNSQTGGTVPSAVSAALSGVAKVVIGGSGAVVGVSDSNTVEYWGSSLSQDVSPDLSKTAINFVAYTASAFAAIRSNGTLVAWGSTEKGGSLSYAASKLTDVSTIVATVGAFAAVTSGGTVVSWGHSGSGASDTVYKNVQEVVSSTKAFAALHTNGSVSVWGSEGFGGSIASGTGYLEQNVKVLCANDFAFTAVKVNGSAISWGHSSSVAGGYVYLHGNYSSVVSC